MIVERLMKPGTWDLTLLPDTPKSVRDVLQPFGHVVVYETRVDSRIISDADLLANALYVGVLRRKPTPFQLSGAHITLWIGDEEGKGSLVLALTLTANTFAQWVTAVLNVTNPPITPGTLTAVAGTMTQTFNNQTTRQCLDYIMQYFTGLGASIAEYRVNNNATLDAGPSPSLFATTPTAIVMPREGGRDSGLVGIEPAIFNLEIDADSYTTQVLLVGTGGTGTANLSPATTYKDLRGNLVQLTRVVTNGQATAAQVAAVAAAQLALFPLRQVITLSTNRYDIPHDVRAGDWLYVYDPEHDIADLTNPQNYRGGIVYPVKLRVFALTWPIETGMAVYYRDGTGVYTDITNWVQFEAPGTTFELGAPLRTLTF